MSKGVLGVAWFSHRPDVFRFENKELCVTGYGQGASTRFQ